MSLPPRRQKAGIASDFAGFFIALSLAIPAGLLVWAAVIAALVW